ncbi:LysR family transcriptional regulator [Pelagibaculum spongiae]|uniref:LysR family transcriptional regulator n=1 Tax=Pelagibaculum spongiae TaxID=2080658 RepID=A0A2V1H2Y9_9GAMM|nr:LysR substrate-binding domain-containing protein [Pelagibaculum spongiae]PVZ69667.1 LysR family transcriptional regulator [Pelagibaculum spongiae]
MADRRLQVFHTVARVLSFTKAAEVLHMTQPAVTFQIRQLEEYFAARLFDRTHNRIRLTEAGKRAYQYSERIFTLYSEMENSVKEITGEVGGVLVVAASTSVGQHILTPMLGKFRKQYPDVTIRMKVGNCDTVLSMVEHNLADIALVEYFPNNKHFATRIYGDQPLCVILPSSHPLSMRQSIGPTEMMHLEWVGRERGSGIREIVQSYLTGQGVDPDRLEIAMELGSNEAVKTAVAAGHGAALMPRIACEHDYRQNGYKMIRLEPDLKVPVTFVYKNQKFHLRAMEELLNYAAEYLQKTTT